MKILPSKEISQSIISKELSLKDFIPLLAPTFRGQPRFLNVKSIVIRFLTLIVYLVFQ